MILAFIVALLVTMGLLAIVSGVDSRETVPSDEQLVAMRAVSWHCNREYDLELAQELGEAISRLRRLRLDSTPSRPAERAQTCTSTVRTA
jgi:hypothetical protein